MTPRLTATAAALATAPALFLASVLPATAVPVRFAPPSGGYHSPSPSSSTATLASDKESSGVVLIDTVVGYGTGEAAGTGLILTSDGLMVTNHHVVQGSTEVEVTDPATDTTYLAEVIGYEPGTDVAVLQLQDASGLATVELDTAAVSEGDEVTVIGNSNGGGVLTSASGEITDTDASITVSGDDGEPHPLRDLIEVDATVVPGDSGGALLDDDGEVIGMNVAASSDGSTGYAIPIPTVVDLADQILSGDDSGAVTLGYGSALGLQVSEQDGGLVVLGVVDGGAADDAGITAGSVLTELDGTRLDDYDTLSSLLAAKDPGDTAEVTWIDTDGDSHTATATLGRAPLA